MSTPQKILIVEDERPMARALELKLTHSGFDARSVGNGEIALALLQEESFDLIFLDLIMPQMDGFTVLQKVRERGVTTPVIVLSNLSQVEDKEKARELGAKGFFIKSNTPIADIVALTRKVLKIAP